MRGVWFLPCRERCANQTLLHKVCADIVLQAALEVWAMVTLGCRKKRLCAETADDFASFAFKVFAFEVHAALSSKHCLCQSCQSTQARSRKTFCNVVAKQVGGRT
jgi:hypothetical protein